MAQRKTPRPAPKARAAISVQDMAARRGCAIGTIWGLARKNLIATPFKVSQNRVGNWQDEDDATLALSANGATDEELRALAEQQMQERALAAKAVAA